MIERPPSPEPLFLNYLLRVLEEDDPVHYRLGRCREAVCHRINRVRDHPYVLKELLGDASSAPRDLVLAEATVRLMRNRIWLRLREVA